MVYAAPLAARPGFPKGSREKARKKYRAELTLGGTFDLPSWAYTKDIPFLMKQAHTACLYRIQRSPGGVEGWNKEETRRVSDAVKDKLESDEALPERSDRECDDMVYGVWGRRPPT